ncbi:hypothetical protein C493_14938 [Natronolimnohabitans innermongolicus JCM 12255]|uniref:Uncharacterized protein n=1 Tax=Natronolimnohabitans innermongolicus JCM 12255 TaxID=1227499 RepID=L9WV13_9EURY|nr:hypothetical protein C493_14938 [Natronolimnohabitans innermongolicus JCM 12255]
MEDRQFGRYPLASGSGRKTDDPRGAASDWNAFRPALLILSDSSQYEVGCEFAAVAVGDGRSSATDRHAVLSDGIVRDQSLADVSGR